MAGPEIDVTSKLTLDLKMCSSEQLSLCPPPQYVFSLSLEMAHKTPFPYNILQYMETAVLEMGSKGL